MLRKTGGQKKPRRRNEGSDDEYDEDFDGSYQSESELEEDDKGRIRRQILGGGKDRTSGGLKMRDRHNFTFEEIQRVIKFVADQQEDVYMEVFGPQPKVEYVRVISDLLYKEGLCAKRRLNSSLSNRFVNMGKQYEAYMDKINSPGHGPIGVEISMQEANERVLRDREFRSIQSNFKDLHRVAMNSQMRARYYKSGIRKNIPYQQADRGLSAGRNGSIVNMATSNPTNSSSRSDINPSSAYNEANSNRPADPSNSGPATTTSGPGKRKSGPTTTESRKEQRTNGPAETRAPDDNESDIDLSQSSPPAQPSRKRAKLSDDAVATVKTQAESEAKAAMKRREAEAIATRLAWEEEDRSRKAELRSELDGELLRLIRIYQTLTRQAEEALNNKHLQTFKDLTFSSNQILDQIMRLS